MQQGTTIPQTAGPNPEIQNPNLPTPKKPSAWRSVISTVIILIAAPLLALGLTSFVFQSYQVEGQSMETTLQDQDRLIVLKVPRTLARITNRPYVPHRGEIVIFNKQGLSDFGEPNGGDKQLIKRVIGLPGERVVVKEGTITVYNQAHPEGFNPDTEGGYGNIQRITPLSYDGVVPPEHIFVSGDNRTNSLDSRTFGPVPVDNIVGELIFRLIPISKAKTF